MKKLFEKLASNQKFEHWGLPKEQKFPLDTPDLVKMAAAAFDDEMENMSPSQRIVCARNICARARAEGIDVGSHRAHKYASADLSPYFKQWLNLRKEATCHLNDAELDQLDEVAQLMTLKPGAEDRVRGLDKVAAALEDFDEKHGLKGQWGSRMPDPAYTVYGQHQNMDSDEQRVSKVASYSVHADDLESADWKLLEGKLEPEIINGIQEAGDKLAVFDSLPLPHKEIITQTLFAE